MKLTGGGGKIRLVLAWFIIMSNLLTLVLEISAISNSVLLLCSKLLLIGESL
jgi:hypothetical protein